MLVGILDRALGPEVVACSPENEASYRTLKKLDGEFIELVEVPARHLLYSLGEKSKYIFRYKINL